MSNHRISHTKAIRHWLSQNDTILVAEATRSDGINELKNTPGLAEKLELHAPFRKIAVEGYG